MARKRKGWDALGDAVGRVHEALVTGRVLVPVKRGREEQRLWADCELASFAENRLGEFGDPFTADPRARERWTTACPEASLLHPRKREYQACYWIVRQGERAGTLALGRSCFGDFVHAYSLYLRPPYRGKGIMADTLRRVFAELAAQDLGLRLEVDWTWQNAVRFYLRRGLWLRSWKHALAFVWRPGRPAPILSVGDDAASVAARLEGKTIVLARAQRRGDRLVTCRGDPRPPRALRQLMGEARSTLALALALKGWPLIRSHDHWERSRWGDLIHPEALASRIQLWEAWAVLQGWRVETPRIPGLDYPTWSELNAPSVNPDYGVSPELSDGNQQLGNRSEVDRF